MAINTSAKAAEIAIKQGEEFLKALPEDVKAGLGAGSGNIKFLRLLGNPYKTSPIIGAGKLPMQGYEKVPQTIGALFEAMAPVRVPCVPAEKKPTDPITSSDLTWREVAAGEKFALTLIEVYILAIQPEYSLFFGIDTKDGEYNPTGCRVVLKWSDGKNGAPAPKIPTATFSAPDAGVVLRQHTEPVCAASEDRSNPQWTSPLYEKFAPFIVRNNTVKTGGTAQSAKARAINDAKKTSLYCKNLLDTMLQSSSQAQ